MTDRFDPLQRETTESLIAGLLPRAAALTQVDGAASRRSQLAAIHRSQTNRVDGWQIIVETLAAARAGTAA